MNGSISVTPCAIENTIDSLIASSSSCIFSFADSLFALSEKIRKIIRPALRRDVIPKATDKEIRREIDLFSVNNFIIIFPS